MCVFITVSKNEERSDASRDLRTAPELWVVARARRTRIGLYEAKAYGLNLTVRIAGSAGDFSGHDLALKVL